jgi:hypothetical protein
MLKESLPLVSINDQLVFVAKKSWNKKKISIAVLNQVTLKSHYPKVEELKK